MFHDIDPDKPASGMNMHPKKFISCLNFLNKQNYQFLKASDLLTLNIQKNQKYVCLTFDDGFVSNYKYLLPIVLKFKIPVTIFLSKNIAGEKLLNEQQIKEMQSSGFVEFGAHTLHHPNLNRISDENAYEEISASKEMVEKITEKPCDSFAYPYGRYELKHVTMLKKIGFKLAFTTKKTIKPIDDFLEIPRLSASGKMNKLQFYLLLSRGRYKV